MMYRRLSLGIGLALFGACVAFRVVQFMTAATMIGSVYEAWLVFFLVAFLMGAAGVFIPDNTPEPYKG